ncbi:MAG: metallophosphoesterase [Caldilineaceae bacterium]
MQIGIIGDIHGRVFHALAAVTIWQLTTGKPFDLLLHVGDLGAFPDPTQLDAATKRYLDADPAETDFSRMLQSQGERAAILSDLRQHFATPIYFPRGNHEDFVWLNQLPVDPASQTAQVDPFDFFRYVPDGTVLEFDSVTLAFLGGVQERTDAAAIDCEAHQSLLQLAPNAVDIMVTHQGPYGSSVSRRGDIYGSPLITELIEHLRPTFHVAGHAHVLSGPQLYGQTTYLGLDCLVASPIWQPEARGLQAGCLAVIDTDKGELWPVTDEWLAAFDTPFDLEKWCRRIFA